MERNFLLSVFVAVLMFAGPGLAATVGNLVGFPEENEFSFGLDSWDIGSKDMFEYDDQHEFEIESDGYAFRVSYGLTGFLALDVRLGQGGITWAREEPIEWDKGIMWGFGVRALLYESEDGVKVISGVQYNDYNPDDGINPPSQRVFEVEADDMAVSVDVSKEFVDRFTIYGGVQRSDYTLKFFHDGTYGQREGGLEQDREFGIYGGFDVKLFEGLSFFAEKHLLNEDAYSIGLMYIMIGEETAIETEPPSAPPVAFEKLLGGKSHVGVEMSSYSDRSMIEEGGLVPEYDSYRMESDRYFLTFSYDVIERISLFLKLGKADLNAHSSEGETTEFDPEFAWALGARGKLAELDNGIVLSGEISGLWFKPEDEQTVSSAKEALKTPGDMSIDWSEFDVSFDVSKKIEDTTLYAGVSFTSMFADQDRELADGTVVSSEFDAEDDLGLFVGFMHAFTDNFSVTFRTDFVDIRQHTVGGVYSF